MLVGSLWLLFAGHNQPGGGFVGGLLAGSAITLRYIAGGIDEVRGLRRVPPWTVLGTGLLLAAVTAAVPLLLGEAGARRRQVTRRLAAARHGQASRSAAAFDIGVYLVVVGMVLMVFEAFGDDPDGGSRRERHARGHRRRACSPSAPTWCCSASSAASSSASACSATAPTSCSSRRAPGQPAAHRQRRPRRFSDPLPQALALTAIVITFAVTAFLLALAYRSWLLTRDDEVQDDVEDRLDRARAAVADEEVADEETSVTTDGSEDPP